jgi:hypothetical protein
MCDEEKTTSKPLPLETIKKFHISTSDEEFINVQQDGSPTRTVTIRAYLPSNVEESLVRCLKADYGLESEPNSRRLIIHTLGV